MSHVRPLQSEMPHTRPLLRRLGDGPLASFSPPRSDAVASDGVDGARPRRPTDDEFAFFTWLTHLEDGASPKLAGAELARNAMTALLRRLVDSPRALRPRTAHVLGVPADAVFGDAAELLLWAVEDPTGPRCRSYRAGVYFLRDRVHEVDLEIDTETATPASARQLPAAAGLASAS